MDLRWVNPFKNSTKNIIKQMTEIDLELREKPYDYDGEIVSYGVASVINFSGKIHGRLVIDIYPELAKKMVSELMGEVYDNIQDRMFLAAISEINNTIAGDANTELNNDYSLGLRLAPPIVMSGKNIVLTTSKMTSTICKFSSPFGDVRLYVGFLGRA